MINKYLPFRRYFSLFIVVGIIYLGDVLLHARDDTIIGHSKDANSLSPSVLKVANEANIYKRRTLHVEEKGSSNPSPAASEHMTVPKTTLPSWLNVQKSQEYQNYHFQPPSSISSTVLPPVGLHINNAAAEWGVQKNENTAHVGSNVTQPREGKVPVKTKAVVLTTRPTRPYIPPWKRWITVGFSDGRRMGNVMFNYASLLGIARKNGMTPVRTGDGAYINNTFDLPMTYMDMEEIKKYSQVIFGEQDPGAYDSRTQNLSKVFLGNITLSGFFQSWRYFAEVEAEVRKHFTFKPNVQKDTDSYLKELIPKVAQSPEYVRVGIHVRRGDVLTVDKVQWGYIVPHVEYFQMAMDYFKKRHEKLIFVVCSDDMTWAKQNIVSDTLTVYSTLGRPDVDLAILASMDHVIMSIGTFGWWGAWLAHGTTIYFKDCFRPGSPLDRMYKVNDIFPPHWIPM